MSYQVDPAELRAAGMVGQQAGGALVGPTTGARQAINDTADKLTYQRAAGMAEALGQKSTSALTDAATVLGALGRGLDAAANTYSGTDAQVSHSMGSSANGSAGMGEKPGDGGDAPPEPKPR